MLHTTNVVLMVAATLALLLHGDFRADPLSKPEQANGDQPLAIIVNSSNTVNDLSKAELRGIFLGERSHWSNGRRITLVMLEPGRAERKALLRDLCQMSETEYNNRILHGLFTGELFVSPKTLTSPTGVRKFVFNVPGAIGYVRITDVDASVKVVRIDGRLPEDKAYPLRVDQHAVK